MGWVWKERQSWRGSYRDEAGKQHTKSFKRQVDAKRWVATEESKVVRGDWIDPSAGKVTFAAFYADWAPRQVWVSSTRENADLATAGVTVRRHAAALDPAIARRSLGEAHDGHPRADDDRHPVHDRPWRVPRGGRGPAHRQRPDGRRRTASQAQGRGGDDASPPTPTWRSCSTRPSHRTDRRHGRGSPRTSPCAHSPACAVARRSACRSATSTSWRRTLRVTRQLQRAKPADIEAGKNLVKAAGGITVDVRPPKYESERTIYLPDELVTILSEHVRQHTPDGEPTRWLFDEGGKPWHDNLVDYRWRSTRTDAGSPTSCTTCGTTSPAA